MLFLICVAGAGTLAIAALALIVALDAQDKAERALSEHGYTLDAADELFEDHEERLNTLENGPPDTVLEEAHPFGTGGQ